jgi:2-C-methyl-D-erythritol 2,4-cyclodiphosphate synthase
MRVGFGYDVHAFVEGRRLVLGGMEIPHSLGLLGHSDADVLLHAISDAMLGAAALGDIGRHFPDTDPSYAGISSLDLLQEVAARVRAKGYCPQNIDATVVAQQPRLGAHIPAMVEKISAALGLSVDQVNVKATTTEWLGFTGRSEGIAAYAVVLLETNTAV